MFAVLHLADFALQAVLRTELPADPTRPEAGLLPDRPAALLENNRKKAIILAATVSARAAGVELGLTAPQALARCSHLQLRTPNLAAEQEARGTLLALGFTLSPSVEDTAPGVCTLDWKGLDPKKYEVTAQNAIVALAQHGLVATVGIASTPLLALYAARTAPPPQHRARARNHDRDRSSSASTIANTRQGVLLVADPSGFLAPLPLSFADPTATLAEIFHQWGLRTLGDLTALPRDEIVRRFGAEGLAVWNRAAGGTPRPLHLIAPSLTFAAKMEFEHAVETLEPLLFILRRFIDRLTLELREAQQVAAELELTLQLDDETRHPRHFRLPEPTGDAEILFRALHTHLESLRTAAPIRAVALRILPTRPLVREQGLFETGLRDPYGFAETLARIVAVVGSDRVGTPQLEDTHRPDAFTLVSPAAVIPPAAAAALHPPLGLPLRRFRPPLPVKLEFSRSDLNEPDVGGVPSPRSIVPRGEGTPPTLGAASTATYLWTERFQGAIAQIRGPWPSNGDWWQAGRAWQRIEWDIALADGGLYRLLQIGEAWFIEGEYD